MSNSNRLEAALTRLSASLQHLEAAAARRAEHDAGLGDRDEEFLVMQDDRARLAVELDGALARSRALLAANTEVSSRLQRTGATIATVLSHLDPDHEPQDDGAFSATPEPGGGSGQFD